MHWLSSEKSWTKLSVTALWVSLTCFLQGSPLRGVEVFLPNKSAFR